MSRGYLHNAFIYVYAWLKDMTNTYADERKKHKYFTISALSRNWRQENRQAQKKTKRINCVKRFWAQWKERGEE